MNRLLPKSEIIENKRKAINARNLIINKVWEDLQSLLSGYDKEVLKADGNFRKNLQTAINFILDKYRLKHNIRKLKMMIDEKNIGNIRLQVHSTNYGRMILKTDVSYMTSEQCCNYAGKDIHLAMVSNDNKIEKLEDIEYLCVFNKNCVISVMNELLELKREVEVATANMNAVKHGPYHEFLS